MRNFLILPGFACLLTCLLLSACGGDRELAPTAQPSAGLVAADAKPAADGLALSDPATMLRAISDTGEGRYRLGKEYDPVLSNRVTTIGDNARLAPAYLAEEGPPLALTDAAYALYSFDLTGSTGEADVSWGWLSPPVNPANLAVGLSNFAGHHWEWYTALDSPDITLEDLAPYKSATEQMLVVVALTGAEPAVLSWIKAGANIPPTARLLALKQTAPGIVYKLDAGASSDVDGTIVLYEWDFDNDGTYDDSGTAPLMEHDYGAAAPERAGVRVTDDKGATDTAEAELASYDEEEHNDELATANALPAVPFSDFRGNIGQGGYDGDEVDYFSINIAAPGFVTFFMYHIDEQADLDMKLLRDNGDGTTTTLKTSASTDDDEAFEYEFTEPGVYYWQIYLYSGAPDDAMADYKLATKSGHSEKPVADITATPNTGDAPLAVSFDASGTTDPEGAIVLYEFDFESDGVYDLSSPSDPVAEHTYTLGGDYTARVRVTDDFGWTDTDSVTVSVYGPPPEASFTATPDSGDRVLTVLLDASGSGGMDKYEWDFDGDGRIDLTNYGVNNTATAVYYTPGSYAVWLRVTDNQDREDFTTRTVTVTGGPDSESEPNNDADSANTAQDAALANALPAFPFADYFGHAGPKAADGNPGDPDDWFEFTVTQAGEVDLYLELYDAVCDIDMKLYAEGNYTDYIGSSAGVDDDEQIVKQLDPGTYYLRVYAFTAAPAAGGYRLQATFAQ